MPQDEREELINRLLDVLVPLAPNAPKREKERVELIRALTIKNSGWRNCPIERLRHEVYGNAAA